MNFELFYNNVTLRILGLMAISLLCSLFYLWYLNRSEGNSFFKTTKFIYTLQAVFWVLFLGNIFSYLAIFPLLIEYFIFELIILTIVFLSLSFLFWKFHNKEKISFGIVYTSIPLALLFVLSLGMT